MNRVIVVRHELVHACVARHLGREVFLIVTLDESSFVRHSRAPEPDNVMALADDAVIAWAGGVLDPPRSDDDKVVDDLTLADFDAAIAAVPRLSAADAYAFRQHQSGTSPALTDTQRAVKLAHRWAEITGIEYLEFLSQIRTRADALVAELGPLIEALTPLGLAHPLLTGEQFEAGIQAHGRSSTRVRHPV